MKESDIIAVAAMGRFTFGKNKKRADEADTSATAISQHSSDIEEKTKPVVVQTSRASFPPALSVSSTPWKRYKLAGSPFPRYRHTAATIASERGDVYLLGGLKEGSVYGDTWRITPHGLSSTSREIGGYEATNIEVVNLNNPPARVGHSSVLCGNAYIVFGGDTVDTDFNGYPDNNFYLFNINNNKYTIPSHVLNKPKGRYGHTLSAISFNNSSSKLYLYGGQLENEVFDDLLFFELNSFKSPKARWEVVEPANNFKPPPLTNHSMSAYKNKLYVFGGVYNNEKVSNDLWCFDTLSNKWTQLSPTGNLPPPVNEHSSCVVNDRLFIYGGNDFTGVIYDFLYVLDLQTLVWSKLTDEGKENSPGARCGHSMTYLGKFNKLLIMGGDKNDYVSLNEDDFETYETSQGNDATMLYELDLNLIDYFLSSDQVKRPLGKRASALAAATSGNDATAASQKKESGVSLARLSRNPSIDRDDFRTPNASPFRDIKNRNVQEPLSVDTQAQNKEANDRFVDVDIPSGTISENDTSFELNDFAKSPERVKFIQNEGQSHDDYGLNGHSVNDADYEEPDISNTLENIRQRDVTPKLGHVEKFTAAPVNGSDRELDEAKSTIASLNNQLKQLRFSTSSQIQEANEKLKDLQAEIDHLRTNDRAPELEKQLSERDEIIFDLKRALNPDESSGDKEIGSNGNTVGRLSDLSRSRIEVLELRNRLVYLEKENAEITEKLNHFEPFMSNQIGDLSNFQKVIKAQEDKIRGLVAEVTDQEALKKEILSWKSKYENLELEHKNFRAIHAETEPSDLNFNSEQEGSRAIDDSEASVQKPTLSGHLENVIGLWSKSSTAANERAQSREVGGDSHEMVTKLQQQLDDLLTITKNQEAGSAAEIESLRNELGQKLQSLKTMEQNYKDALLSVNNTSKALNLTQDELNSQRIVMEKLIKENNELKLFKKASRRVGSRTSIVDGNNTPEGEVVGNVSGTEDDEAITNVHYTMKLKDLEADLYILRQERDQLKDDVTTLKKELYLSKSST